MEAILQCVPLLAAAVLAACNSDCSSAEPPDAADDSPIPFVQRWGLHPAPSPMDYHPGTRRLLAAQGGTAVLWDAATGLALDAMEIGGNGSVVAFSADGRRVLTASGDGPLRVWDVETCQVVADFESPPSQVQSAAISPDGRYVAAGCYDHTALIWDVLTGKRLHRLAGHHGHVISVRFSPDSQRLLSGAYDGQAILWDIKTGRTVRVFPTPVETRSSSFRADGRRILTLGSGSEQGMGRIVQWDVETRQPVQVIAESAWATWFVDAAVAVLMPDNEIRLYRETDGTDRRTMDPTVLAPAMPANRGESLSLTPGGWQVWTPQHPSASRAAEGAPGGNTPSAALLRSPTGVSVALPLPLQGADAMEFVDVSPDGTRLMTAYRPRLPARDPARLVLWDLEVPAAMHTFPGTLGRFHPDGRHVLAGGVAKLQLYRMADGSSLQTYAVAAGAFESARFVAGGRQLLTASGDWYDGNQGKVLLWDVATGEVLRDFFTGDTAVYEAVMDREEKRLLAAFTYGESGSIDKLVLHDAESAEPLHVISSEDHRLWALHAAVRANRFASGNERQTSVWSLTDSRLLHQFAGLPGPFSPDGRLLATHVRPAQATLLWHLEDGRYLGSFDTTITAFHPGAATAFTQHHPTALGLLDLETGRQIAELFTFGEDQWLAVTAQGDLAGSQEALRRVTWRARQPGNGPRVDADPERNAQRHRPQQVAEILTRSLPQGRSPADALANRTDVLPEGLQRQATATGRPELIVRSVEAPQCTWLATDAQGHLLLASYEDGTAALWQLGPVRLVHHFPSGGRRFKADLTPDGRLAIVAGPEPGDLTLWDTGTGRQQAVLAAPDKARDESIAALAIHPKGSVLAVLYHGREEGSPGRTIIWDLAARQVTQRLTDPSPRRMSDIAFTPDGRRLVIGYRAPLKKQDQPWDRLEVWDWQTETRERGIPGGGFSATSLSFSGDGRRLLAREGWELVVRDFQTGEPLARWSHQHGIPAGVLSRDGESIVGSTLGEGRLFRSTVANPERRTWTPAVGGRFPRSRYAYAYKLLAMDDRNLLFSPDNDGCIRVWSMECLRPVADLYTRNGHRDFIARAAGGVFTASEGARPQLSWELGGRRRPLKKFQRWLERPDLVAEILAGEEVELPEWPAEASSETETFQFVVKETSSPWPALAAMRQKAGDLLKQAGAELRIDRDDAVTFVQLERRPISDELLQMLPWLSRVDRLYLAATGITDDQLGPVGLMRHVKRLSLWGNPITDAGLAELSAMWSLEVLDVHNTSVTAEGLRQLRLLPALTMLIIPTEVDAELLARDLGRPGLVIVPRAGEKPGANEGQSDGEAKGE